MEDEKLEQQQPTESTTTQTPEGEHTVIFEFDENEKNNQAQQQPPASNDNTGAAATPTNEGAADLKPAPPNPEKKDVKQLPAPAKKSRETKTVSFYTIPEPGQTKSEFDYIDACVQARIAAELTQDYNHFIRQCVDYALNNSQQPNGISFAKPDIPPVYLKGAFFNNKK